ncbi:MAG: hypothetical protein ACC700_12030, partial [Anaerolineales bacterium]
MTPINSLLWPERNAWGENRLVVLGDLRFVGVARDADFAARLVPLALRLVDAVLRFVERLKEVRLRLRFAKVGLRPVL